MDVLMVAEAGEDFTAELKELQNALLNTDSVDQFLHEMAVLAARLTEDGLSCGMTMQSNGRPVTEHYSRHRGAPQASRRPRGARPRGAGCRG
jgi:hypothetical protein